MTGKSDAEVAALLDNEPPISVSRNQTFQIGVSVTDPSGVTTNYTGSPRLRYESHGCLVVTSTGTVTVTPSSPTLCASTEYPELWVILTDGGGTPIAANIYFFHVQ